MIVAHAGNRLDSPDRATSRFPASQVPVVRRRIRGVLSRLAPELVVSAAAGGADLIVLEEATGLSIPTEIVLPLPVDAFRRRSVDDHGPDWVEAFERAVASATRIKTTDYSGHDDWAERGNTRILDRAASAAMTVDSDADQLDREVVALVVQPPSAPATSVTSDFVQKAERRGWSVIVVDPLAPESAEQGR